MQSKTLPRRTLLIAALAGLMLSLSLLLYFTPKSLIRSGSATPIATTPALSKQERITYGLPVRLKIPSINVDAPVEYVGLTPDGAMDVPKERAHVAWFNLGPRPGENGSAVIAGHYGWRKDKKGSVFDNLHTLRKGDTLYIEDDKGMVTSFVVRESRMYDPEADASDVFGSSDGRARLNLVTCEGVWDKVSQTYSKRRVVFAEAAR